MTNEEKAEKIVAKYEEEYNDPCNSLFDDFENIAIEMAKWKDKQHSIAYVVTSCEEDGDYKEQSYDNKKR